MIGFQDQRRAERAARKRDRIAGHAITQWDRAEYWQTRTAGVIAHAIGREKPATRRSRIKRLEADQRKQNKTLVKRTNRINAWAKVRDMEGADQLLPLSEGGYGITDEANDAGRLAYSLANDGATHAILPHPRDDAANEYAAELHGEYHRGFSPYNLLTCDHYAAYGTIERLTPKEVAELYLDQCGDPEDEDDYGRRWARHYQFRLEFERAMLTEEGGAADDHEMIPGGWLYGGSPEYCIEHAPQEWNQIQRVHKSPATGKVTSVKVWGVFSPANGETEKRLVTIKVERFAANRYRPPTPEELAAFQAEQKAAKKAKPASKRAPLINPTDNDAEALQAIWNQRARDKWQRIVNEGRAYSEFVESDVCRLTQSQYAQVSKGNYASAETRTLHDGGYASLRTSDCWSSERNRYRDAIGPARCRIRQTGPAESGWWSANRVIILTDKPQKPLPIDWEAEPFATKETSEAK